MPSLPANPHPRFINRDLSWLAFNDRVLAQAEDDRIPLLERVKFLAIFASNLDEFFMKRVGLVKRRMEDPVRRDRPGPAGLTVDELAPLMRRNVEELQERQAFCWLSEVRPALHEAGVRILSYATLTGDRRDWLDQWYEANVFPILTPLTVDPSHRFPFISNLSENFGVLLTRGEGPHKGERSFARIKIPGVVPRFVRLPRVDDSPKDIELVALDDLIAHNLEKLFPGRTIDQAVPFRVTRSAAIAEDDDDDELDDMLLQVEAELRRRRFAKAVRLETPANAGNDVLEFVTTQLDLGESDVYRRRGPLEYQDLFEIAALPRPDLKHEPWTPVMPPRLAGLGMIDGEEQEPGESIFDRVRTRDVLVHHPYESFEHSAERFIAEAAVDPDVLAIKLTLYRTSPDSPFVSSLIRAAEAGKNVAALVELRARFDEQRNVVFARRLEHAGVHVAYGVVGLKTHCKCLLVVRRERTRGEDGRESVGLRTYAHIGTGNYHPKTAQLYTDLGLFTADPDVTADVVKLFNMLTGGAGGQRYDHLLVAPDAMRSGFCDLIDDEIANAKRGKPSRIVAKMNQLEDKVMTDKLYEASQAGVPIDLIVRGFCCLRPGVPGLSETIRVTSVVGRFLEHSRVVHFAGGSERPEDGLFFIGSADWMYRNLSDRVEAHAPVRDRASRASLWRVLETLLSDQRNAWVQGSDGVYERLEPSKTRSTIGLPDPQCDGAFEALMADAEHRHLDAHVGEMLARRSDRRA
ncbi:MAG: polyphosphate kinase 1 [Planctomycetota bacterium]